MRLFVALQIPAEVRDALAALLSELRQMAGTSGHHPPKSVRPENLHVTLKFKGELVPGRLSAIQSVLASVHSQELVNLDFLGLGFFPNENRPSILWTGVNGIPNLPALASKIDQSLEKTGISREPRPFSPHLTLARFEPPGIAENLRATVQKNMQRSFGSCAANEFQLIESKFKPSGAEYTTVQTYRFVAAEA